MALEQELETYFKNLARLLDQKGKFVLIHHEDVIAVYDT
jgi:hypothetical protein